MDHFYLPVQGLVQIELIFFITACKVLWFRLVTKTLLITHNSVSVIAVPAQCQDLLHLSLSWPCEQAGVRGEGWEGGQLGQLPQTDQRHISYHIMWHSEVKPGRVLPQEVSTSLGIRLQVVTDCLCITWLFLRLFHFIFLHVFILTHKFFSLLPFRFFFLSCWAGREGGIRGWAADRVSPSQCPKQTRVCGVPCGSGSHHNSAVWSALLTFQIFKAPMKSWGLALFVEGVQEAKSSRFHTSNRRNFCCSLMF